MSEEKANALGLRPKAKILASTVAAVRPEIMGLGPIPAIQALLKQTGIESMCVAGGMGQAMLIERLS